MSANTIDSERTRLAQELNDLRCEFSDILKQMNGLDPLSSEYGDLLKQMDANLETRDEVMKEYEENLALYQRPNGRITGFFSRLLAPLPSGMKTIKMNDESKTIMATLPSYRLSAFLAVIGVIGSLLAIRTVLPILFISPLSIVFGVFNGGDVTTSSPQHTYVVLAIAIILVAVLGIGMIKSSSKTAGAVRQAALDEELWFRSGAENWTFGQRLSSCVAFGFCHIINIIYPLATLLILTTVGYLAMMVYLREYQRSHDTVRATLASTKFHAMYNTYLFVLLAVMLMLLLITSLFIM